MHKSMKSAQGGFTLIELIVVIVILGILAATALPRFANLGGDARLASLNAARGALSSVAAMAHGQFLTRGAAGNAPLTLTFEGTVVNFPARDANPAHSYPVANAALAAAAGLGAQDYTVYTSTSAGANVPVPAPTAINIVPISLVGTASALTCFVTYTEPTGAALAPTITVNATAQGCE